MKYLLAIPVIVVVCFVMYYELTNHKPNPVFTTAELKQNDSSAKKLSASIKILDSLKPAIEQTIQKIKYYEGLRTDYQAKIVSVGYEAQKVDEDELTELKSKLAFANSEIDRLKNELLIAKSDNRVNDNNAKALLKKYTEPSVETPDDNALIIEVNGKSKKGSELSSEGLSIYLIPYTKSAKRMMTYEASCNQNMIGNNVAKYYNGQYFFNDVKAGKYLIKICTYYGDYKLITKESGKYKVEMQIAPPLQ